MIKRAISREIDDDEYQLIDVTYTEETFQSLINKIELVTQLPQSTIDVVLLETIKEGKTSD